MRFAASTAEISFVMIPATSRVESITRGEKKYTFEQPSAAGLVDLQGYVFLECRGSLFFSTLGFRDTLSPKP